MFPKPSGSHFNQKNVSLKSTVALLLTTLVFLVPNALAKSNSFLIGSDLGKRLTSSTMARLQPPKDLYSFGMGKRSVSDEDFSSIISEKPNSEDDPLDVSVNDADMKLAQEEILHKRDPYAFGLGKRLSNGYYFDEIIKRDPYTFGLGKRDPYAFGLGKRGELQYSFGLGKRDPYAFGLGKRNPYTFGLGRKRDPYSFGLGKRDPYNFGLGKRSRN